MGGLVMIPVFRMEEHGEAYAVWHRAVDEGLMGSGGNLLLHVDHHDDLECGPYRHDFSEPTKNAEEALSLVREVLGIADFIVPALWEGVFDRMINFKRIFPGGRPARTKVVQLRRGCDLVFRDYIPLVDSAAEEGTLRLIRYEELSLTKPEPIEQPVVLDIDLDYFCWDDSLSTGRDPRLEITREAFEAFQSDPRHPLRIHARRMVYVEQAGERYYLRIQEPGPPKKLTRDERICQRVEKFFAWLDENQIRPAVIDICRSRISGYCPADRWARVEELVLAALGERFPLQPRDDYL